MQIHNPKRHLGLSILVGLGIFGLAGCVSTLDSLDKGPRALMASGPISGEFGAGLDAAAKRKALDAEIKALSEGNTGAATDWSSGEQFSGKITPGQPFEVSGRICRRYTHSLLSGSIQRTAEATACQNKEGLWEPLS